jgi:uracil-DNA glycosylase
MNEALRQYYLTTMGINPWLLRKPSAKTLEQLSHEVEQCKRCQLSQSRTHIVFGAGPLNPLLMVIGEAPGFHEDKQGLPFVGRAGGLLSAMLKSIGFTRDTVYIANVVKCRPPQNREPTLDEVLSCSHFLKTQIESVKPKLLLAVGTHAAQYLTQKQLPLSQLRSNVHDYHGTTLMITYHPAYLLRNPMDKSKAFEDLLKVKATLEH